MSCEMTLSNGIWLRRDLSNRPGHEQIWNVNHSLTFHGLSGWSLTGRPSWLLLSLHVAWSA